MQYLQELHQDCEMSMHEQAFPSHSFVFVYKSSRNDDGGSMADQTPQGSKIPTSSKTQPIFRGPMTRARAKKFREFFQALVRDVQVQVGDTSSI